MLGSIKSLAGKAKAGGSKRGKGSGESLTGAPAGLPADGAVPVAPVPHAAEAPPASSAVSAAAGGMAALSGRVRKGAEKARSKAQAKADKLAEQARAKAEKARQKADSAKARIKGRKKGDTQTHPSVDAAAAAAAVPDAPVEEQELARHLPKTKVKIALLIGGLIVLGGLGYLIYTENTTISRDAAFRWAERNWIRLDPENLVPIYNNKLSYTTGEAVTESPLVDPEFGIGREAVLRLRRKVEMYQWRETRASSTSEALTGAGAETAPPRYDRIWSERPIDSAGFLDAANRFNPEMPIDSHQFYAEDATLGPVKLMPDVLDKLAHWEQLALSRYRWPDLPTGFRVEGDILYAGAGAPATPEVGDVRVRFDIVPAGEISVLGGYLDGAIASYAAPNGELLSIVAPGAVPPEALFAGQRGIEGRQVMVQRAIGVLVVALGMMFVFLPKRTWMRDSRLFRFLLGGSAALFSLGLALPLAGAGMAVLWLPVDSIQAGLLGGPLSGLGLVALIGSQVLRIRKNRAAAEADAQNTVTAAEAAMAAQLGRGVRIEPEVQPPEPYADPGQLYAGAPQSHMPAPGLPPQSFAAPQLAAAPAMAATQPMPFPQIEPQLPAAAPAAGPVPQPLPPGMVQPQPVAPQPLQSQPLQAHSGLPQMPEPGFPPMPAAPPGSFAPESFAPESFAPESFAPGPVVPEPFAPAAEAPPMPASDVMPQAQFVPPPAMPPSDSAAAPVMAAPPLPESDMIAPAGLAVPELPLSDPSPADVPAMPPPAAGPTPIPEVPVMACFAPPEPLPAADGAGPVDLSAGLWGAAPPPADMAPGWSLPETAPQPQPAPLPDMAGFEAVGQSPDPIPSPPEVPAPTQVLSPAPIPDVPMPDVPVPDLPVPDLPVPDLPAASPAPGQLPPAPFSIGGPPPFDPPPPGVMPTFAPPPGSGSESGSEPGSEAGGTP